MKTTRYGIDDRPIFVIDPSRCIGCEACGRTCKKEAFTFEPVPAT